MVSASSHASSARWSSRSCGRPPARRARPARGRRSRGRRDPRRARRAPSLTSRTARTAWPAARTHGWISGSARPTTSTPACRRLTDPEWGTLKRYLRSRAGVERRGGGRRGSGAAADRRPVPRARARVAAAVRRGLGQRGLAGRRAVGVPLPAARDRDPGRRARDRRPARARRRACRWPSRRPSSSAGRPSAIRGRSSARRCCRASRPATPRSTTRPASAWRRRWPASCGRCTTSRSSDELPLDPNWRGDMSRRVPRTSEWLAELRDLWPAPPIVDELLEQALALPASVDPRGPARRPSLPPPAGRRGRRADRRHRLGRPLLRRPVDRPLAAVELLPARGAELPSSRPTAPSATISCCARG